MEGGDTMDSKTLANRIEDEQTVLHDAVRDALQSFTDKTGLCVPSMNWVTSTALNENGNTEAVTYWNVTSNISTGIM